MESGKTYVPLRYTSSLWASDHIRPGNAQLPLAWSYVKSASRLREYWLITASLGCAAQ